MLTLVLLLLTSVTDGRVSIVERSTLGVSPATGASLRERLKTVLTREEISTTVLKENCTSRECLMSLARERGTCVVGVTLVKNKKGLTVDVEAVDGEVVVLQNTFLLTGEKLEQSPEAQVFAHKLRARLVDDRPVAEKPPTLEPKREVVEPSLDDSLARAPQSVAPTVLTGVAIGSGVVAISLLIASAVVKGQLDAQLATQPVTGLTRVQAQQQADLANGLLAGSVIGFGVGIAAGATALLLP